MAKLFETHERIVPTWLAAARYLDTMPGRHAMNLVLEIPNPLAVTDADRKLMAQVDDVLDHSELTLATVAGTIFPLDFYKRYGRPAFYDKYLEMLVHGKKHGTWGTYAARMIDRPARKAGQRIRPLDLLVERLSDKGQPMKRKTDSSSFISAYELGVCEPEDELGGEVPTYYASNDAKRWLGFPCLSHVSFKRVPLGDDKHAVNLTAVYRSHHYCARALGNLLGLSQLLWFVAKESKLKVGTLSCVSSYAALDVQAWGGVAKTRAVIGAK